MKGVLPSSEKMGQRRTENDFKQCIGRDKPASDEDKKGVWSAASSEIERKIMFVELYEDMKWVG